MLLYPSPRCSVGPRVGAVTLPFPLAGEQTQQEHPHPYLVGSDLGLGPWAGPSLRKGQAALPSAGCHQAAPPSPPTPSWERNRSITAAAL
jgi:hypothetical protein